MKSEDIMIGGIERNSLKWFELSTTPLIKWKKVWTR